MATTRDIQDLPGKRAEGNREAMNEIITALGKSGVLPHHAPDEANVVTAADATDLATSQTLNNQIKAKVNSHLANTGVHSAADATNTVTSADQSNLATGLTLGNEIKGDLNAHFVLEAAHRPGADIVRSITSADATDQATLNTLLNEIKRDWNRHCRAGASDIRIVAS